MAFSKSRLRILKRLHKTFKELLREKAFEDITAVDIARKAKLNRTTFYHYFADKYDMYRSLHKEVFKKLSGDKCTREEFLASEPPQQIIENFEFARNDASVRKLLVVGKLAYVAREVLSRELRGNLRHNLDDLCGGSSPYEADYLVEYVAHGHAALLYSCARDHWRGEPIDFARACQKMRRAALLSICPSGEEN